MSAGIAGLTRVLSIAFAAGFGLAAHAADIGQIKAAKGQVSIVRGGQTLPGETGAKLQAADVLKTGADGSVGVTLADDTLLTAGPASTLVITDFRFDSTTNEGGLLASLWKGTLHVVTGLIAKQAPQNVNVQTRNAVMGVRGTEFIVDARGDTP